MTDTNLNSSPSEVLAIEETSAVRLLKALKYEKLNQFINRILAVGLAAVAVGWVVVKKHTGEYPVEGYIGQAAPYVWGVAALGISNVLGRAGRQVELLQSRLNSLHA